MYDVILTSWWRYQVTYATLGNNNSI